MAGVRQLVQQGVMKKGDRVVAVLTGHLLKDPSMLIEYHRIRDATHPRANPPIEIEATVEEVERAMGRES